MEMAGFNMETNTFLSFLDRYKLKFRSYIYLYIMLCVKRYV